MGFHNNLYCNRFFWLIPWLDTMLKASIAIRHLQRIDPSIYDVDMSFHFAMTLLQTVLILFIVIISIFKPWAALSTDGRVIKI